MARRIGEILLEHGWIEPPVLDRALARQQGTRTRLCSLLVAGGALGIDEAARALGEQHGVLAVLQKHLDGRDHELATRLPAALARSLFALPIGRMGNGDVIVCVRDPDPALADALSRAMSERVVLAVTPAHRLEALVDEAYPVAVPQEFEVDLDTGPIDRLLGLEAMMLVDLDDSSVSKDPSQSGQIGIATASPRPPRAKRRSSLPPSEARPVTSALPPATSARPTRSSLPPATSRPVASALAGITAPRTVTPTSLAATASLPRAITPPALEATLAIAAGTEPPSHRFLELPVSIGETLAALALAPTTDDVGDLALRFARTRWTAALLLVIEDGAAVGYRGHGTQLSPAAVQAVTIPLSAVSIVRAAHDARALVARVPAEASAIEERLERLLGMPQHPAAAAITIADRTAYVLVTGDSIGEDPNTAILDLGRLATALGVAFSRIHAA